MFNNENIYIRSRVHTKNKQTQMPTDTGWTGVTRPIRPFTLYTSTCNK